MKIKITILLAALAFSSCSMLQQPASINSQVNSVSLASTLVNNTTKTKTDEITKTDETISNNEIDSEVSEKSDSSKPIFPSKSNIDLDNEVIDDNSIRDFSGRMIIENNELYFQPNDCAYKNESFLLDGLNGKKFKHKKWLKKVKKSENKVLENVTLKGIKSSISPVILVKKASKPLNKTKTWSSGQSALYLQAAQELYLKTIELREKYKIFSVNIQEVDDPNLGRITEYSIYDKNCKKLTPEEIKNISDKDLNSLNSSVKIGGGLLLKQAALTGLAALSTNEIATCSMFEKIQCGKDGATAAVYQAAIVAQLPKIVKNLKASKKYIEQLRAE